MHKHKNSNMLKSFDYQTSVPRRHTHDR